MKIMDMLTDIKEGQSFEIGVNVTIGEADVHALNVLSFLYNELPDDATFAEAERVLSEALWWHITFNTITDHHEKCAQPPAPEAFQCASCRYGAPGGGGNSIVCCYYGSKECNPSGDCQMYELGPAPEAGEGE